LLPLRAALRFILKGYHSVVPHGMPEAKTLVTDRTFDAHRNVERQFDQAAAGSSPAWLKDCAPDIVCLQETKCLDEASRSPSRRSATTW
jgi:hypothetical protein